MTVESIIKADPLTTTREVAKELNVDHSMAIQHWKLVGKVKKFDKWMPHELYKDKKKPIRFEYRLLLFYTTTTNHFSIKL